MPTTFVVVFLFPRTLRGVFHLGGTMHLTLIKNPDTSAGLAYRIARIVYAQTGATSLPLVEAFTSMIKNLSDKSGTAISDIICDPEIFDALSDTSPRHNRMTVPVTSRAFQMCLRTARLMLSGGLVDSCNNATCFHYADEIPAWATSRGYIADIEGMLFYL